MKGKMMRKIILSLSVLFLLVSGALHGAELYVDLNCSTPSSPYTNWTSAATDIQSAVDAASAGDVIWVTNGQYKLTGEITVSKDVTIQSVNGPEVTIVNAQRNGRCFNLSGPDCVLSGLTVTGGYTLQHGGGILCASSSQIITNCIVSWNQASGNVGGGGILNGSVFNSDIFGNSSFRGGGAYATTLKNCKIIANNASDGGGGLWDGSAENCLIVKNSSSARGGGGAYGTLILNCTVCDNSSSDHNGGGISYGTAYNSIIYYNSGGLYDDASDSVIYGSCGTGLTAGFWNITNSVLSVVRMRCALPSPDGWDAHDG